MWEQNRAWLFYYFNFERNYDVFKSKGPSILLIKNINFNKNKTEWKTKNLTHSFTEMNIVHQLIWGSRSWSSLKKKEDMFCTVYFEFFFDICVLPQCTVYWIQFQNIHTFTYQKTLIHTLFDLFLKSLKAFSVSLKLEMIFTTQVTYSIT